MEYALLTGALLLYFTFEAANGFHDTANAVATVIYTKTLPSTVAVVWSGCWNFIGVAFSNGAVAYTIVSLLPPDVVAHPGTREGLATIFALLVASVAWNIGTWSLGIPASSSHTLIGSIVGVGIAHALFAHRPWIDGVNWHQLGNTFLALITSPIVGFAGAAVLLLILKAVVRSKALFAEPQGETPPPWPIRCLLVLTCTGVSYAHGTNDGQKGIGIMMLIFVAALPGAFPTPLISHGDHAVYLPIWAKLLVALCLGIGTMVGWKRIVTTIGDKIGKAKLTYAEGASAEIVTFATIETASMLGFPVSTTHVLTSGVAGTMDANRSGLQMGIVREIVWAWVLTVPATVLLGSGLFAAFVYAALHWFGAA